MNMNYQNHALAYFCYALLILLCLSPNLIWLSLSDKPTSQIQTTLIPALVGIGLITSLASHVWIGTLLLTVFAILSPAEAWFIIKFGMPSNTNLLGVILESDAAETISYSRGLLGYIIITLILTLSVAISAIRYFFFQKTKWLNKYRILVLSSSIIGLLLLNIIFIFPDTQPQDLNNDPYKDILSDSPENLVSNYAQSWPTGLPVRIASHISQKNTLKKISETNKNFKFNAKLRSEDNKEPKIVVLVIGESSRPDHWQIYGYNRPTTPKLAAQSNLVLFRDVVTPWPYTRMSVPVIITRKPASMRVPFFPEKSIISAFKEAGYKTAWLSNQSAMGVYENTTSLYAQEADQVSFLNPVSYKNQGSQDDILIPAFRRALNDDAPRKFIVLHTLGSHFNYTHRYPKSFEHFSPTQPQNTSLSLHNSLQKELLTNAYDNSVLFTDEVLNTIIETIKSYNQSAILLYISDHGENLFDNECNLSGHGNESEIDYRVPMIFWYSDVFAEKNKFYIEQSSKNSNRKLNTENVFHSLLDVSHVTIPDENPTQSVFSDNFKEHPRWITASNGIDFNNSEKGKSCKLIKKQANF